MDAEKSNTSPNLTRRELQQMAEELGLTSENFDTERALYLLYAPEVGEILKHVQPYESVDALVLSGRLDEDLRRSGVDVDSLKNSISVAASQPSTSSATGIVFEGYDRPDLLVGTPIEGGSNTDVDEGTLDFPLNQPSIVRTEYISRCQELEENPKSESGSRSEQPVLPTEREQEGKSRSKQSVNPAKDNPDCESTNEQEMIHVEENPECEPTIEQEVIPVEENPECESTNEQEMNPVEENPECESTNEQEMISAEENPQRESTNEQPAPQTKTESGLQGTRKVKDAGTLSYKPMKVKRTVISDMMEGSWSGPLSILRRSVEEKIKVRVVTRSVRNIRGISTGYIVAFDKHMNLAMMDVDEIYRKQNGKHKKKPKVPTVPRVRSTENSNAESQEVMYPKTPWMAVNRNQTGGTITNSGDASECQAQAMLCDDDSSEEEGEGYFPFSVHGNPPSDGIGNLSSKFCGMHVFDENETTLLLGVKTKKLLRRHLNQVMLRGEQVVSVSLVELNVP